MARTDGADKINPKHQADEGKTGAPLQQIQAADSQTWRRGDWLYLSSGTVTPVSGATGGVNPPWYVAAEDQSTSTASSQDVWVRAVPVGSRWEMYVTASGTDGAIAQSNVGTRYGLYGAAGACTLDTDVENNAHLEVSKIDTVYDDLRSVAAETPGKCIVKVRDEGTNT